MLFTLNHYPEAAELNIVFNSLRPKSLVHLVTKEEIAVRDGCVTVDIDRKSGEVYRLIM